MNYLNIFLLYLLNKNVKLNYNQSLIYYSFFSYISLKRILYSNYKLNGSRKYISLLCGDEKAIENARNNKWNYKYIKTIDYPTFICKNIFNSLYIQRKTLFFYISISVLVKLYLKQKVSLLDYKNTLRMLIGFPLLFWILVLPIEKVKKIDKSDIHIICTVSAIISFLNEDKKRRNTLAHFMLTSLL